MLVISTPALLQLQSAITAATHGLTDIGGKRALIGTIDSDALKSAALIAIQIASKQVIWPGDETATLDMGQERSIGPFRVRNSG